MLELFTEELFKCDVCEKEFVRNDVIKIGYGDENYVACRKCFKMLIEE